MERWEPVSKRFEWASFFQAFGALTLSLASGAPTVIFALVFYLQSKEPPHSGILTSLMIFSILAAWVQWWKEHKAHKRETAELINSYEATLSAKSRDWNGDWLSLEKRFLAYDKPIVAVCDFYDGNELWRLETSQPGGYVREFQELCTLGVALLRTSPGAPSAFAERARSNSDYYTIWLSFVQMLYGHETEIKSNSGVTSIIQVTGLKKVSAMACQHCAGKALL